MVSLPLILLLASFSLASDYCSITSRHTMCQYQVTLVIHWGQRIRMVMIMSMMILMMMRNIKIMMMRIRMKMMLMVIMVRRMMIFILMMMMISSRAWVAHVEAKL